MASLAASVQGEPECRTSDGEKRHLAPLFAGLVDQARDAKIPDCSNLIMQHATAGGIKVERSQIDLKLRQSGARATEQSSSDTRDGRASVAVLGSLQPGLTTGYPTANNLYEFPETIKRKIFSSGRRFRTKRAVRGGCMPATAILGQIMPFAGAVTPRGWAQCNGQLMSIQQNTALFSLLGTTYGGNGVTSFALPDLRGRAILGATATSFPYIPPGGVNGETEVYLTVAQIPSHNHTIQAATAAGGGRSVDSPANNVFGTNTLPSAAPKKIFGPPSQTDVTLSVSTNVVNDGGGVPHNNMQPYLVINYLIALQGIFPSRS